MSTKEQPKTTEQAQPKTNNSPEVQEKQPTNQEMYDALPSEVRNLLEAHLHAIKSVITNQSERVEYKYNSETRELQFMTGVIFDTPEITTEKPIDYQEK